MSAKILVVDDIPANVRVLEARLQAAYYSVITASSGAEALEKAAAERPDLVLLDVMMPEMDGFECCRRLKSDPATASIPVVIVTALDHASDRLKGLEAGADDFLTKPIKPEHLISAVSTRIERYRTLRSLMICDSLTGLLNHTNCMEHLEFEIACALRQKHTLCFAMLDIDHFKSVNDTHGHPTGDKVIKSMARLLTQRLRKSDIIGRYGGEEFAVVLPATPLDAAAEVLDNLRQRFERITQRSGDGTEFHVTFSCGIVELSADNGELLHELADKALYQAKTQGRNRVAKAPRAPTPFDNA